MWLTTDTMPPIRRYSHLYSLSMKGCRCTMIPGIMPNMNTSSFDVDLSPASAIQTMVSNAATRETRRVIIHLSCACGQSKTTWEQTFRWSY